MKVFTRKLICGALRNLVPFVQFKEFKQFCTIKNTHGGVLVLVKVQAESCSKTFILKVRLLHWCFQPF